MKKEEKLEKCRKIKIQEKIELKDVEMQADPCKGNNHKPCKHDCCVIIIVHHLKQICIKKLYT